MMIHVLTKAKHGALIKGLWPDAVVGDHLEFLKAGGDVLLSFGSGVIVPKSILERFRYRYNFHAASPAYPGRDPHHWAAYDGASTYGATAHVMTEKVDAGEIVGVVQVPADPSWSPQQYRAVSESALKALLRDIAKKNLHDLPPLSVAWTGTKRSRADLIAICDMRNLSDREVARRKKAFTGFEQHFRF